MKVNWKVRFKNKLWLSSFISAILVILYTFLDAIGVVPNMSETRLFRSIDAVLMILSLLGVIIDPTTAGMNDSARAQGYAQPWDDKSVEYTEEIIDGGNG